MKDAEWELTRAFCNLVLRWGMEREAEQIILWRKKARLYRQKVEWRLKRDLAYKIEDNK